VILIFILCGEAVSSMIEPSKKDKQNPLRAKFDEIFTAEEKKNFQKSSDEDKKRNDKVRKKLLELVEIEKQDDIDSQKLQHDYFKILENKKHEVGPEITKVFNDAQIRYTESKGPFLQTNHDSTYSKKENNSHYYQNIFIFIFIGGTLGLCFYYIYTLHQTHDRIKHHPTMKSNQHSVNSNHYEQYRSTYHSQHQQTYYMIQNNKYSPTISQPCLSSNISTKEIKYSQSPHYTSEMYNLSTHSFTHMPSTTAGIAGYSITTSTLKPEPLYISSDTTTECQQHKIPFINYLTTSSLSSQSKYELKKKKYQT
jgi:hypothetical protein